MVTPEQLAKAKASLDSLCANDRQRDRLIEEVVKGYNDVVFAAWWDDERGVVRECIIKGEEKLDELFRLARLDYEFDHPFADEDWDESGGTIEAPRLVVPVDGLEHARWLRERHGAGKKEQRR
jgi:hypothetical protein